MTEGIRLQKFLSQAGRASRREAEDLMRAGRVRVNGHVASEMGIRVVPGRDRIELDGEAVTVGDRVWVAFHKPAGVLTTRRDPHGGETIYDVLPDELSGLNYVGRLDRDAEGLLLVTNDGDAAHKLQHPSSEVEREYWVEVTGTLGVAGVRQLIEGVELDDGAAVARRAEIIEAGPVKSSLTLVLTEGRKREVRRMMSTIGHPVLRLKRIRYGSVLLGDLQPGEWRYVDVPELDSNPS